jgi:protein disulfide-isomerase A1
LYKKFDELKNVFEGTFDDSAINEFVKVNSTPLMADIGPENYASYSDSGIPLAYLFIGNEEHREDVGRLVEVVAKEFKGKINFVYIDGNKFGGHAGNLNLKQTWPAFAIQRPQQNLKFPYDQSQPITTEGIRAFVQDFLDGKINPSLKSEEIPATQTGPVTVVVGKQYHEIVNQPKDVLIEFYAPWCGHCKKLTPVYDELATQLKDNANIVIAKMDATANDLPADVPFQVSGFPTIKLVKADNTVIDYNGDRSLNDFIKFLKENSSTGKNIRVNTEHNEL